MYKTDLFPAIAKYSQRQKFTIIILPIVIHCDDYSWEEWGSYSDVLEDSNVSLSNFGPGRMLDVTTTCVGSEFHVHAPVGHLKWGLRGPTKKSLKTRFKEFIGQKRSYLLECNALLYYDIDGDLLGLTRFPDMLTQDSDGVIKIPLETPLMNTSHSVMKLAEGILNDKDLR